MSFQVPITQFAPLVGGANKSLVSGLVGTSGQVYTSNGAGIAPTFAVPEIVTYISGTINFKSVGNTTIFTTEFGLRFIAVELLIICDAATAANGDAAFNAGTNAATFDNWISGGTAGISVANTYTSFMNGSTPAAVFAASTAVVFRVAVVDSGTALTGRAAFTGFYI